jgi:hypothetical protein
MVLCEPCWTAWQGLQQPFAAAQMGGPSPSAAAVLGLIPGVGAMYNGQFFKGLIHVVIFAVLVSVAGHGHGIFGIFIGAWILYQSFEAFHTAKALREGQAPPDPLGLNEVGNWLNLGMRPRTPGQPNAGPGAGYAPPAPPPGPGWNQGWNQAPGASGGSYQAPYTPPGAEFGGAGIPPVPPVPPFLWRRKEPVGAVILIALGLLFLLGQMDIFSGRLFEYAWPLLLIGLGVWLIVRRLGEGQGGCK